jgi:hypothetical protein
MTPEAEKQLKIAQELARAGIVAFPCGSHKKPVCWWKSQATNDPDALAQLWKDAWQDPVLIGVPTGAKNDIAVLDLDKPASDPWLMAMVIGFPSPAST